MEDEIIERARLLGMDVEIVEVEGVHLSGTYQDTDQGRAALDEDLNNVVTLLLQHD
jgi:hypothetical protein